MLPLGDGNSVGLRAVIVVDGYPVGLYATMLVK